MGICLGHQIISYLKGGELFYLPKPVHGQSFNLPKEKYFSNWDVNKVQYYNSIGVEDTFTFPGVETIFDRDHLISMKGKNTITYQFHPESVGTDNSLIFYEPMIEWNKKKLMEKFSLISFFSRR